ncbi:hypothetical protein F5Y18DRAFT_169883 [Xylariaceae sp. FL1019]|nr:hypothetical protein F5Y18DRAFT_169883 [Xylariaceae sp. FL1019]
MKITELYIYPIKSLAPLAVTQTRLRREGLEHDRRFMLLKVQPNGEYKNIQTAYMPECVLFDQKLEDGNILITYRIPSPPLFAPEAPEQRTALRVPLCPKLEGRDLVDVKLMGSSTTAYRMGDPYDSWFSACFGYKAILVYIGNQGRPVLAHRPSGHPLWQRPQSGQGGWLSSIAAYIPSLLHNNEDEGKQEQLVFNECAPFLLTSRASLRDVSTRLPAGETMDMRKFRPNIVVDETEEEGKLQAWDEDYWAEVVIRRKGTRDENSEYVEQTRLALTANCARCVSINIDYETGQPAKGELGTVLKKLMKDRRVDPGSKWSPIFGRYAFLPPSIGKEDDGVEVRVGDDVEVVTRLDQRDTWSWPKY